MFMPSIDNIVTPRIVGIPADADAEPIAQAIGLGGAFAGVGRSFEADQAFYALEGEFDPRWSEGMRAA
jgi:hypothetical protein